MLIAVDLQLDEARKPRTPLRVPWSTKSSTSTSGGSSRTPARSTPSNCSASQLRPSASRQPRKTTSCVASPGGGTTLSACRNGIRGTTPLRSALQSSEEACRGLGSGSSRPALLATRADDASSLGDRLPTLPPIGLGLYEMIEPQSLPWFSVFYFIRKSGSDPEGPST